MLVVQGSGAQANVQQEQADEREGPVEDRVAVLRRYGPNFPLPGGFLLLVHCDQIIHMCSFVGDLASSQLTLFSQLTMSNDESLQCLSFRLDFNQHYKKRDSRLSKPLTFSHR